MLAFFLFACKKNTPKEGDFSGSYTIKRFGYSYWCEKYKSTSGADSIPYYGFYTFKNQPGIILDATSIIAKTNTNDYSICIEGNCANVNFNSIIRFERDSVDFGSGFKVFGDLVTIRKMKGVKTATGFKGEYIEYTEQPIRTSANPHSHIFVGTFELIKQ